MPTFRFRRVAAAALAALLPLALTACGSDENKIVIGTKFDQPGLAIKNPDGSMSGFDVDVAAYIADKLGYSPSRSNGRKPRPASARR